jgi:hypothetical protein
MDFVHTYSGTLTKTTFQKSDVRLPSGSRGSELAQVFNVFHVRALYYTKKTLNTNKCTKSFFLVNYNTLLHVSTLLGRLQGETFRCRYTMLHCTVQRECAADCALHSQQFSLN